MDKNPHLSLKWEVHQRLMLLEATVFWTGELVTGFLTETFGISRIQATKDIALYLSFRPENLRYDRSLKRYVITDLFKPLLINGQPQECLLVMQASKNAALPVVTLISNLPAIEMVAAPVRLIDVDILRPVLQAARFGRQLEIVYQSLSSTQEAIHSVLPHALVFDGLRWHMRAFSWSHNEYRDFVLARVFQVKTVSKTSDVAIPDRLWESWVTVKIGAHPGLNDNQKKVIERDYGMIDGSLPIPIRAALVPYLLLMLRVGPDDYQRQALVQQIVLLNRVELQPFLGFS